jgi:hypothetical protein
MQPLKILAQAMGLFNPWTRLDYYLEQGRFMGVNLNTNGVVMEDGVQT